MAEKWLYNAAAKGDEKTLDELLKEDPLVLDRVSYTSPNKTPLHIATIKGHLPFVEQTLNHNPHLAEELDSQQSSALHAASAKGYLEIVKKLLSAAPDMCLSRDSQGRNRLHLAAIKGHARVLEELIGMAPFAAREKMDRGLTLLHLCVKYGQFEALKILVLLMNQLLNWRDDDGASILHMAIRDKRIEIIQYLLGNTNIDVNAKNSKGETPMSLLDPNPPDTTTLEIRKTLTHKLCYSDINTRTQPVSWLNEKRDAIMVVAVLIATMAFQAGMNPAGGVWQEDSDAHRAGEAIMARNHPKAYESFVRFNESIEDFRRAMSLRFMD
ncbi:26S proteasome regulatory complex, subunit PSMD10 [Handroanthus impetiginosus]|uniref:26S proteasome regulatory complex, subunit PSMD10 n=1 Tax=Handroanthus impetiginosus TaxID=429701 RepID=A0A2G9HVJ4_9LAMI|nr:26S proteasome regulatory complex, subunit PSMD10 [Handroanthus impetiginosus]